MASSSNKANDVSENGAKATPDAAKDAAIFKDLSADDAVQETTVIESACMNCFRSGMTRLLLTKIPFYKEVVLMSFKCEHCGFENSEIQSASEIQKTGIRIVLNVQNAADLNRRVVRSDYTSVSIPEVELEIPSQSQKGGITTVEGIIDRAIRGLSQDQEKRRLEHPQAAADIDAYIVRLNELKELKNTFTLLLEDISGNSFIENPVAPALDKNCKTTNFVRTQEQNQQLGLYEPVQPEAEQASNSQPPKSESTASAQHLLKNVDDKDWKLEDLHGEVLQFETKCPHCGVDCTTNMKVTNIPHFKEVIIMATSCDACGWKTNEVKSGTGVETHGIRFKVRLDSKEDLSRDVLKSETCNIEIPELELQAGARTLEGRFTTIEGILVAMKEQLVGDGIVFHDSADEAAKNRLANFTNKFEKILKLEEPITVILDDPAGNSYVQSLSDDNKPDDKLKVYRYERSFEQNEELGLNDIKTEDYETQ